MVRVTDSRTPTMKCHSDAQRLPWSRVRRTAVIAVDGALAVGTGAFVGLMGAGAASPTTPAFPTPGWAPLTAPLPGAPNAASADPEVSFSNESCASADFCAAIGDYVDANENEQGLLETYSGGSWSAVAAPLPTDAAADPEAWMKSVSCPTTGWCEAVGGYDILGGGHSELIETYSGGQWSLQPPALPHDVQTGTDADSWLKSVSCASSQSCDAVGYYENTGGGYFGLLDSYSDGQWSGAASAQPSDASTNQNVQLTGISCLSSGNCAADGFYSNGQDTRQGVLLSDSNGTWTAVGAPLPNNAAANLESAFSEETTDDSISCAGSICEAVAWYETAAGSSVGLLESLVKGTWTPTEAPEPTADAATDSSQAAQLNAVSCTADGGCTAVGHYSDTNNHTRGLIEDLVGGNPTAVEAPEPPGAATPDQDASLGAVSCLAAGECTAVGSYATEANPSELTALIDTGSAGGWSAVIAPLTNDTTVATANGSLATVQCTARGACLAAGTYSDTSANLQGLFETFTPMPGYWEVAGDGGVFSLGSAQFHGSQGATRLNKPIVGMAATPGDGGYWLVASDGGIFTEGNAPFLGSQGATVLNKPIVGMAATPDGQGYWLVASDGGIFTHGDAQFYGSLGNIHLNAPIVGMAATPDGRGYWLVASDGGVFTEGDAQFYGSMGGQKLNEPIVGMAANVTGNGYWLVASDGGVFSFGDALFHGSTGAIHLNKPIVGLLPTFDGGGYWEVASDGGIFAQGDAQYSGSEGAIVLNSPVVNGAAT
jgi:hypothetical protein